MQSYVLLVLVITQFQITQSCNIYSYIHNMYMYMGSIYMQHVYLKYLVHKVGCFVSS